MNPPFGPVSAPWTSRGPRRSGKLAPGCPVTPDLGRPLPSVPPENAQSPAPPRSRLEPAPHPTFGSFPHFHRCPQKEKEAKRKRRLLREAYPEIIPGVVPSSWLRHGPFLVESDSCSCRVEVPVIGGFPFDDLAWSPPDPREGGGEKRRRQSPQKGKALKGVLSLSQPGGRGKSAGRSIKRTMQRRHEVPPVIAGRGGVVWGMTRCLTEGIWYRESLEWEEGPGPNGVGSVARGERAAGKVGKVSWVA